MIATDTGLHERGAPCARTPGPPRPNTAMALSSADTEFLQTLQRRATRLRALCAEAITATELDEVHDAISSAFDDVVDIAASRAELGRIISRTATD